MRLPGLCLLLCLVACSGGGQDAASPDRCQPVPLGSEGPVPEGFALLDMAAHGDSLKAMDHAIVVDDERRLHVFWTRGMEWIAGQGRDFGHASTTDLVTWQMHPRIRLRHPSLGIDHQWAPQVVREGDGWRMYFTGVERDGEPQHNRQRIFASASTDLLAWTEPELVLEPRHPELAWGHGTDWSGDARDQFLFLDQGEPAMLLTVRLLSGPQSLALARPGEDGWEVSAVLGSIQGDVIESPFLIRSGGQLLLFLNNWKDGGQQIWTAQSLDGPWRKQRDDLRGFAFEMLQTGPGDWLVSHVFGPGILFSRMRAPELTFTSDVYPGCPEHRFELPVSRGLEELTAP